jgi:acetyltransferase-like isoleucine patch superfamily enzyme
MVKKIIRTLFYPIDLISRGYFKLYNFSLLKLKGVEYSIIPEINGKIFVNNMGKCILGQGIRFNSTAKSNWMGLFKPCTLFIGKGAMLVIGDHSGFSGVSIYCSKKIIIGKYLTCGGNVSIWDTDFHPLGYRERRIHDQSQIVSAEIVIGDDVFIGANSIILKGVSIGNMSIIGAGSVVTKNIPQGEIWAGNPAKSLKKIEE